MSVAYAADLGRAVVRRAWDETASLRGLVVAAERAATGAVPGQYVQVETGGQAGFFAIAGTGGDGTLELLVRRGAPAADALALLEPGDGLLVSPPLGAGFPVDEDRGRDLVLVAAGAGIAPLRAVIEHVLARRADYGTVTLFHGEREGAVAYAADHDRWRAGGIGIVTIGSREAQRAGRRGYVQDALRGAMPPLANAAAYLCGQSAMTAETTGLLVEHGLPRRRIHLNV